MPLNSDDDNSTLLSQHPKLNSRLEWKEKVVEKNVAGWCPDGGERMWKYPNLNIWGFTHSKNSVVQSLLGNKSEKHDL